MFPLSDIFAQQLSNPISALHDNREFIFGIDNRITSINDKFGVIYGLYSGIGYGNNLRFKFSISGTPIEIGKVSPEKNINRISRLLFASVGQEFDFFTVGRFKLTAYGNAGLGYHYYKTINQYDVQVANGRDLIRPLELGIHSRYQLNPMFAVKVGGGWRFVFPRESKNLDGYYLKLTAVVNPKRLSAVMKKRKKEKR
jgi:hypothetical protein